MCIGSRLAEGAVDHSPRRYRFTAGGRSHRAGAFDEDGEAGGVIGRAARITLLRGSPSLRRNPTAVRSRPNRADFPFPVVPKPGRG